MLERRKHQSGSWLHEYLPLGLLVASYGLIGLAILQNRLEPNYASALTVAYAAYAGLVLVVISMIWVMSTQRKLVFLLLCGILCMAYIIIVILAEQGKLSVI